MPQTYLVFLIGWLAICGIPPFSGFFSKDEILWLAFSSDHGSVVLWALAAATAVMTAFYMTRLFILTFLGKPRFEEHGHDHGHAHSHGKKDDHDHSHGGGVHESPLIMTGPLMVLAVLSAIGGFMGVPHMNWLAHWLEPVIPHHALSAEINPSLEWVLMGLSVIGATVGILGAFKVYRDIRSAEALRKKFEGIHRALENKWYVDELFEASFVRPIQSLSRALWKGFDVAVIDRIVVGFGRVSERTGQTVRVVQSGSTQLYLFMLLIGLVIALGYLVYGMV